MSHSQRVIASTRKFQGNDVYIPRADWETTRFLTSTLPEIEQERNGASIAFLFSSLFLCLSANSINRKREALSSTFIVHQTTNGSERRDEGLSDLASFRMRHSEFHHSFVTVSVCVCWCDERGGKRRRKKEKKPKFIFLRLVFPFWGFDVCRDEFSRNHSRLLVGCYNAHSLLSPPLLSSVEKSRSFRRK